MANINSQLDKLEKQGADAAQKIQHLKNFFEMVALASHLHQNQKDWLVKNAEISIGSGGRIAISFLYHVSQEEYEARDIFGREKERQYCSLLSTAFRCQPFKPISSYAAGSDIFGDYGLETRVGDHYWGSWATFNIYTLIVYSHSPE